MESRTRRHLVLYSQVQQPACREHHTQIILHTQHVEANI